MTSDSSRNSALLDLAPLDLPIRRLKRYHGDGQAVTVEVFTADDRELLFRLYDFVRGLFEVLQGKDEHRQEALATYVALWRDAHLARKMNGFGASSYAQQPSPLLAEVIHDIRGGGLTAILGNIELWQLRGGSQSIGDTLYLLARDHLKIMRNALLGLDDVQRNRDLSLKVHNTDLILDKWKQLRIRVADQDLRLEAVCPETIPIAECCVEFGALDRILYNLLNNAARHTADQRVRLTLFPIPEHGGPSLRFVMQNTLQKKDQAYLNGADLKALFRPGVSSTGSGYGLAVVTEFVANAYGVSPAQAIAGNYLGACVINGDFTVWFHWPIVPELPLVA